MEYQFTFWNVYQFLLAFLAYFLFGFYVSLSQNQLLTRRCVPPPRTESIEQEDVNPIGQSTMALEHAAAGGGGGHNRMTDDASRSDTKTRSTLASDPSSSASFAKVKLNLSSQATGAVRMRLVSNDCSRY